MPANLAPRPPPSSNCKHRSTLFGPRSSFRTMSTKVAPPRAPPYSPHRDLHHARLPGLLYHVLLCVEPYWTSPVTVILGFVVLLSLSSVSDFMVVFEDRSCLCG
ncbi:hypothetical protein VNO80_30553 [Phaseolus coccineus]|uniref:Uncharacterized protein n=1 Tax=Phaseolus coccineus TaxID=3886 RepID=A0AAN9LE32_PHACN